MTELTDWVTGHGWVAQVFLIALLTAIAHLLCRRLVARVERGTGATRNLWDDALVHALRGPVGWLVWILGISWAAQVAGGEAPAAVFDYVPDAREVGVLAMLMWFALRFVGRLEIDLAHADFAANPMDPTTAKAVGKLLRAAILITGVLMVLQGLGFSISGVLAFGGIGGIAVGFAARDLLANFFGALMIFLDRPFSVGDWVRSPDKAIEGTVEDIGWRLTRIRTFDQRPLYVPNALFTSLVVENPSRMLNRRIYETIGLRYADLAALPGIVADVERMLREHPEIDQERTLMVNFVAFGESALEFFVYAFTRTTVWADYHAIKQDVLLRIATIIREHDAEIALPTRRLHLHHDDEPATESDDP